MMKSYRQFLTEAGTPDDPPPHKTAWVHTPFPDINAARGLKDKIVAHLERHGYNRMGSGIYASAVASRSSADYPSVYKISRSYHYTDDDGYIRYIKNNDQSNPHFPRIHSIRSYNVAGGPGRGSVHIVHMEPLEEISNPYDRITSNSPRHPRFLADKDKLFHDHDDIHSYSDVSAHLERAVAGNNYSNIKSPHMEAALRHIRSVHDTTPMSGVDIHAGNIMRRPGVHGDIVITDPLT